MGLEDVFTTNVTGLCLGDRRYLSSANGSRRTEAYLSRSSSTVRRAMSAMVQSSACASRLTVAQVGLAEPASIPSRVRWLICARSARFSDLRPRSVRRSRITAPRVACGLGLRRTRVSLGANGTNIHETCFGYDAVCRGLGRGERGLK